MTTRYTRLSDNIFVHHGCCNVGIVRVGDRALLIDSGNGDVQATLTALGITAIDHILLTHHHRDSASGVARLATPSTVVGVPAAERPWFEAVEQFWHDPKMRWHLYNIHPHNLMLAESVPVQEVYAEGDQIQWGGATITALETPGHTDGSLSYLVEMGTERFVFCGDLIYGAGQLWELYSLQKGNGRITDYHGFLGDRHRVLQGLARLVAINPLRLIPTHGMILQNLAGAVDLLRQRLEQCYDNYVAISALRHYFPDLFADYADRVGHMPIRAGKPVPNFLRHVSTTWVIIAANGEAFVMDCGAQSVLDALQRWQTKGTIRRVTGCWVTHYHDDHVDYLDQFQALYPCPTYADSLVAEVVTEPQAYRLPCISPTVVRIDERTTDGQRWQWNEFQMTAYHFPGQTYYHGGLLVEGRGVRLFFSGDSFTMAGIDDYCSGNRNLLGTGVGFDRCLALMERLQPTHIFNCHVAPAFDFTADEIGHMRANLALREDQYGQLVPWDHANYGLDEHWVRCEPYEQVATPGAPVTLSVVITNHSATARTASARPILPAAWAMAVAEAHITIPPKRAGRLTFTFSLPAELQDIPHPTLPANGPSRIVVPVEVTYHGHALGQFREALLQVAITP
ncbi:MAG: MBL fold metallo-hydrolase [Caldilineaceae bacterium]|nr:MBL fold metallo-hydrolase [Caldilineaceae bacterium]